MVLHTWGQNLKYHPHVHSVVPGGGLSPDGDRWISCRKGFFLHVRVLSRLYRDKFIAAIDKLYSADKLKLDGSLEILRDPKQWRAFLRSLRRTDWAVYSKPPFGGPKQVLKYLARYTHRVAISNSRLLKFADGKVTFRWKDYAHGNKKRCMTLQAKEFIRRFLLHVQPKGFVRIRHFGFLSNRTRRKKLEQARKLLNLPHEEQGAESTNLDEPNEKLEENGPIQTLCPCCRQGNLIVTGKVPKTIQRSFPVFDDSS
jgi:hypothetical protein